MIFSTSTIWSASGVAPLTHSLSCGEITVTLEDMANQLLLPILDDVDPSDIQLSVDREALEVELRKGLSGGNIKLSNWIGAFLKAFTAACRAAFIIFWLCKFVFGSHPYYVEMPVYF